MIARSFGFSVVAAAAIVATAAVSRFLNSTDLVSAELGERIVQVMQVIIGLGLVVWGNYMPKGSGTLASQACADGRERSVVRVGGWAMTLAGLTYAAMWAFAPASVARPIAGAAVATAAVVAMIYCARIAGPRVLRKSVGTER